MKEEELIQPKEARRHAWRRSWHVEEAVRNQNGRLTSGASWPLRSSSTAGRGLFLRSNLTPQLAMIFFFVLIFQEFAFGKAHGLGRVARCELEGLFEQINGLFG